MRFRVWIWSLFCLAVCAAGLAAMIANGDQPFAYIPTPDNTSASGYKVATAVCKIQAKGWSGSGTLIATRGNTALILSCRHVCPEVGMSVNVLWPLSGQSSSGIVVEVVDGDTFNNDLALVLCRRPNGISPVRIRPYCGNCGPWFGLGWRGDLFRMAIADSAAKYQDGRIHVNSSYVGGMSGGPLIDSRGHIVGVVVASDWDTLGICADGPWLEAMLRKYGHSTNWPRDFKQQSPPGVWRMRR